jgi:glutamyl-tRNA synthetase
MGNRVKQSRCHNEKARKTSTSAFGHEICPGAWLENVQRWLRNRQHSDSLLLMEVRRYISHGRSFDAFCREVGVVEFPAEQVALIGRLAPSPTGAQHVGNARTYLAAWLSVCSRGGRLPLRIEDIDSPRIKPGAAALILEDLRWLGLDWDGEPVVQSERLACYREALRQLQEQELVYPCTCTRADVERAASAPHAEHEGVRYPGTCAHRRAADAAGLDRPYCWRFRMPDEAIEFDDLFRGPVSLSGGDIGGDFVVWKNNDTPAYQLAVVVDDAAAGVTEVLRGDDLIPSTPRQLLLYRALGQPAPRFAHLPLVVGPDGRRLAKRHGDTRLAILRAAGVKAEALLGLLGWSCGWLDSIEEITATDLLPRFDLAAIPPRPFVLEPELLRRINFRAM